VASYGPLWSGLNAAGGSVAAAQLASRVHGLVVQLLLSCALARCAWLKAEGTARATCHAGNFLKTSRWIFDLLHGARSRVSLGHEIVRRSLEIKP
jgi:hypothetical protein